MHPIKSSEVLITCDVPDGRRRYRSDKNRTSKPRQSVPYSFKRSRTLNSRGDRDRLDDNRYAVRPSRRSNEPGYFYKPSNRNIYFTSRSRSTSPYGDIIRREYRQNHDGGRYAHYQGTNPDSNKLVFLTRRRPVSRNSGDGQRYRNNRSLSGASLDVHRFDRDGFEYAPGHHGSQGFNYAPDRYNRDQSRDRRPRSVSGVREARRKTAHDGRYTPSYFIRNSSESPKRRVFNRTRDSSMDRSRSYLPDYRDQRTQHFESWSDLRDADIYDSERPYELNTDELRMKGFPYRLENLHRRSESLPPRYPLSLEDDSEEKRYRARKQAEGTRSGFLNETPQMPASFPNFSEMPGYPVIRSGEKYSSFSNKRESAQREASDFLRRPHHERSSDPMGMISSLPCGVDGDSSGELKIFEDVIKLDVIDFQSKENSKSHRTFEYELAQDVHQPTPVFRRGQTFIVNISFKDREFDETSDILFLNFYTGPNPTVPKHTRVVLPVRPGMEFQRVPHQWDARVIGTEGKNMSIEINIPVTSPVGIWHGVLETSSKKAPMYRLQYRCVDDVYIIFNPFNRADPTYMENEEQRYEYVINDCGKIFTGAYQNVVGRPWIYGQFDQCVLPAACILLEMSGLSHTERSNPVKVTRALTSMIRASRTADKSISNMETSHSGLIEAQLDDNTDNGSSPHLWTGSVQIIEEFLRNGTAPVRYGQCWVMAALMTSFCRALGLPARPTTAFVYANDSEDSLTVDRYINHFGEIMEHGPNHDQHNAIWSFHTWCDVWMSRPDHPREYSGWQATDPFRANRRLYDGTSGCIGPCPVEALRRGDVGQRNDVESFYASLNSYVRYFYEDEASGWGYTPFEQFRYPVGRKVLSKAVGCFDNVGDEDYDDLTSSFIDSASTDVERFIIFNTCCGVSRNNPSFEYEAAAFPGREFHEKGADLKTNDMVFELSSVGRITIGEEIVISLLVSNSSNEERNIQANMCARSCFYTGSIAACLKRSSTEMTILPNQQEIIKFVITPNSYEHKLVDMAFVKTVVSGFVQETGQSFVDEVDLRFSKPLLNIEIPETKTNKETEATFTFTNPLDEALTNCFITYEMSGCVRPDTIKIDGRVKPGETFLYKHVFVPRASGDRRMVATFTSRQLSDVVGQTPVTVLE